MRRELVGRIGLMAAIGLGAAACDGKAQSSIPSHPPVSASIRNQELPMYNPELRKLKLYDSGYFSTSNGTLYDWYNFTPHQFNPDAAQQILSFFQTIVPQSGYTTEITINGTPEPIKVISRDTKVKRKPIYILPENVVQPKNWGNDLAKPGDKSFPSAESLLKNHEMRATYLRVMSTSPYYPYFPTSEDYANRQFAVEACQESIVAAAQTLQLAELGQEGLCNSYGTTLAYKQMGKSYTDYAQFASALTFGTFNIQMIVASEAAYNQTPTFGSVVTVK